MVVSESINLRVLVCHAAWLESMRWQKGKEGACRMMRICDISIARREF